MDVYVNNHQISLAEAAAQVRQLEGSYLVREALVNDAGAICFVTASIGTRAINEAEPEPREMRMLERWGWRRHKHGVWFRMLGTFQPL